MSHSSTPVSVEVFSKEETPNHETRDFSLKETLLTKGAQEKKETAEQMELTMVPDVNFSDDKEIKTDIKSDDEGDDTPTLPLKKKRKDKDMENNSAEEQLELTMVPDVNFSNDGEIKIDIKSDDEGDDTPTLPLKKKGKDDEMENKKVPIYIFPLSRLKTAWSTSSNLVDFVFKAVGIIFSTLGWLCCVGGVPFMSLAMLIVGTIYLNECRIQPKIPVYLVVCGVLGTLQHFISVWTKYIPTKKFRNYRVQCLAVDYILHLFLCIWFVLGCIWVYGCYSEVDFKDSFKDEYCNKILYYFAFWVLNLSFILLAILIVCTLLVVLFIVISPTQE